MRLTGERAREYVSGIDIVVVTTSYPSEPDDASGHFVEADVVRLRGEGHRVRVVRPQAAGAFGWPGVAARVRENPWRALDAAAWVMRTAIDARRWRESRVIAHWAIPCAFPIALASRCTLDVVSHGGDVRLLSALPTAIRSRVVRALASRAESWRFVSDALLDDLSRALSRDDAARVRAIAIVAPSAMTIPDLGDVREEAARKRAALGPGAMVAVSIGRLVASKRVEQSLAYAAREGLRVVVVGDGPERARLEAHARDLGVTARFTGKIPRNEALAWIAAADCVLFASDAEGASTVLREADTLGVPIVNLAAEPARVFS